MDKGPWVAEKFKREGWGVTSDDFTHDVCLYIGGDFEDDEQKRKYAEWLAAKLNSTGPGEGGSL